MAYIGNQPAATFAGNVFIQQFSGDGITTQFALNDIPISVEHVDLFIGGVYQNKNTYSVSGNILTCSEAPVAGIANVEIKVFEVLPIGYIRPVANTVDPVSNGDMIFRVINNTSISIAYKGTDGVVRTSILTLV